MEPYDYRWKFGRPEDACGPRDLESYLSRGLISGEEEHSFPSIST